MYDMYGHDKVMCTIALNVYFKFSFFFKCNYLF